MRVDDRGLGTMTQEFASHLRPDVLVIREPNAERRGFAPDLTRFPGAPVVTLNPGSGHLEPEATVRAFLRPLSVLYSAETFYDQRILGWARAAGVRTVLHAMPEFYNVAAPPPVDAIWVPTTWRLDAMPPGTRVVPVPCPTPPVPPVVRTSARRFMHTAGAQAMKDRNGTKAVSLALRQVQTTGWAIEFYGQRRLGIRLGATRPVAPPGITVEIHEGGVSDRWQMFRPDVDVLVLPRRYAGLSLPTLEAMAAGLVVVMTDVEPQGSSWPIVGVPAVTAEVIRTAGGMITAVSCSVRRLAETIDRLVEQPETVAAASAASLAFAADHGWDALLPLYRSALEDVALARVG